MQPKDAELDQPPPDLKALVARLDDGEVVAFPTETFYGLIARVDRPNALRKVFELKGRPPERALPVVVSTFGVARSLWSAIPADVEKLVARFWPGPLTIVLPAHPAVDMLITGGSDTVGIRVPGSDALRRLASLSGGALVATSANLADQPPARSCRDIYEYFGSQLVCAEGPPLPISKGSTVLLCTEWPPLILRQGEVSREVLADAIGVEPDLRN
ncbi:MAG: L-threonylcarbamoyladenylate synthase [Candidatus Lernaella stagnicola]|nr:L-threonylcarbamoyladenylate synthase [Candidatus Lernaella stagnicola]